MPSELAGDLSPCPLGPGLRVMEIARTEGKSAVEGLSLAINGPRSDVCHVLSQFIGQTSSYGPTQTQRARQHNPPMCLALGERHFSGLFQQQSRLILYFS